MGVAGSPKSAVRAGSLASAEKVSAPTKRVASGVRTGATWKPRSRSRRRTSTDLYAAMPPATPRTMRGVDDSGVAEGIGEGVQVVGGVLACLLIRLRLQPLGLELLGGRSVELQLVLVELLEGEGERLVRQRGHLGRDERAVARAQAVVVLVDLARTDGRHRDQGELGVADLGEEVLDGRVDERGAFCHGLVPFRGGETLPAKSFQYREDLPGRSPEVVVDDLVGPQGPRARQFHRGRGEAARHVVLVVAPRAQARLELDVRRGQDQEDGGAGVARAYLLGALDLDLEQDVGVARRVGHRRASDATRRRASVPLPTPPGPISTTTSGSADKGPEELRALLGSQAAPPAGLGDGGASHDAFGLHLADRRQRADQVVGAHLRDALLPGGQLEELLEGEVARLDHPLDLGASAPVRDRQARRFHALVVRQGRRGWSHAARLLLDAPTGSGQCRRQLVAPATRRVSQGAALGAAARGRARSTARRVARRGPRPARAPECAPTAPRDPRG